MRFASLLHVVPEAAHTLVMDKILESIILHSAFLPLDGSKIIHIGPYDSAILLPCWLMSRNKQQDNSPVSSAHSCLISFFLSVVCISWAPFVSLHNIIIIVYKSTLINDKE